MTVLLGWTPTSSFAQEAGQITSVSITSGDMVRLVLKTSADPDAIFLQSADSPLGPWRKEPDVVRNKAAVGFEFLTPHRSYFSQQYYRFAVFSFSPVAAEMLPYIRFISPTSFIAPGQMATLYGANFAPNPTENLVTFELADQSWTAAVTETATNYLIVQVPTNLVSVAGTPTLYRVSVKTSVGEGNGVGASLQNGFGSLAIQPADVYIAQPPGSATQTLIVGGGSPPYTLMPLSAADQKLVSVTLNGPVLTVNALTNVTFGSVRIAVQDSKTNFPQSAAANVGIVTIPYQPGFTAEFHTLLAGTEPGVNLTFDLAEFSQGNFQTEKLELEMQNVELDLSHLYPGDIAGFLQLFDPGGPYYYNFQHLVVTSVAAGKATFDVVSLDNSKTMVVAKGELFASPPTLILDVLNLVPGSLVPQPLTLKMVLPDQLFRLPANASSNFSIIAHFTSVSAREDTYLPQESASTNKFTTTALASGAPRIERLLPFAGELYRNVRVQGSGFAAKAGESNLVTFTGLGGSRVPAEITKISDNEITVAVPRGAITGPVRLAFGDKVSNDFLFAIRFRPQTLLLLDNVTPNAPTGLQLLHQQPQDEHETNDEMPLQAVLCTLGAGHLAVSDLSSNQQVGTVVSSSSYYSDSQSTNLLIYAGQEQSGLKRHVFKEVPSTSSKFVFAFLYLSENADAVAAQLLGGGGIFGFTAGLTYDFHLSTPVFVPRGNEVPIRVEAISNPWTSIPGNEMHVIWNSVQRAQ